MVYEAGISFDYLEDINRGAKTIEGRLNRGKFSKLVAGDHIRFIATEGTNSRTMIVLVTDILKFPTFREMLVEVGYSNAIPEVIGIDNAVAVYTEIYSEQDEITHGVLAIKIKKLDRLELIKEELS